jgi:hypothetical protein
MYRESKHWAGKLIPAEQKPPDLSEEEWNHRRELDKRVEEMENQQHDESWAWR